MNKIHTVIVLGLLVALTPYLGIPGSWKTFLSVFSGLLIALIAFLWARENMSHYQSSHSSADTFSESIPQQEQEQMNQETQDISEEHSDHLFDK